MRLRPLGLVPVVFLTACALPSRDNPRDPAHRPVPLLLVSDLSMDDGMCPCSLSPSDEIVCDGDLEGPTTGAASRGRCLALDARPSSDPDESVAVLDHRFFVRTSAGETELTSPADG